MTNDHQMTGRAIVRPEEVTYRAYPLDLGGGVQPPLILDAEDDETAKAMAACLNNAHGLELWERNRLLAVFPPRGPSA